MKKYSCLTFVILTISAISLSAQKKDTTYYSMCGEQRIPEMVTIKKAKDLYQQQYFDRQGKLRMTGLVKDGLADGVWTYYTDSLYLDNIYLIAAYPMVEFIPYEEALGGKVTADFRESVLNGLITGYYKNGTKWFEKIMDDGMLVGISTEWYPNGQLRLTKLSTTCATGSEDYGYEYDSYSSKGTVRTIDYYSPKGEQLIKNGNGVMYENYPNGNMSYYREYKDSIQNGVDKSWSDDGYLTDSSIYKDGEIIFQMSISRYEYEQPEIFQYIDDYVTGFHSTKSYDKNWNLKSEHYGTSYQDTLEILYYPNGKIKSKKRFDDSGLDHGKFEERFENGDLKAKGDYINGVKSGLWVKYWDNGKLAVKGSYINDDKHDEWEVYNKEGELVKKELYFEGTLVETQNVKSGAGSIPQPR